MPQRHGIARNLVHAVMAEEAASCRTSATIYLEEAAREVVRRLRRDRVPQPCLGNQFGAHHRGGRLPLANLRRHRHAEGFLFVAFRIPYSPAVGVKLIATPGRMRTCSMSKASPPKAAAGAPGKGVPESLVEVLHLAAFADVRMLVFDADAPVLDGLTLYDDE